MDYKNADIAQLVRAGRLYRQGCGFKSRYRYKINARVAQLVERLASNQKVAGSSPVSRSKSPAYTGREKVSLPSIWGSMYQGRRRKFAIFLWWIQFPPAPQKTNGLLAQLTRALALHARGREFESRTIH